MRIQALLLALLIMHLHVVAQPTVTSEYDNAPLQKVLKDFALQTGFKFTYQGQNLANGNINFINAKPVTAQFKNAELGIALTLLFNEQPEYGFEMRSHLSEVTISHKQPKEIKPPPPPVFTIKGKVVDDSTKPVEGATIQVQNRKLSTATDHNGEFELSGVRETDSLVITHVTITSKTIKAKVRESMEIKVSLTTARLQDVVVVVTGYQKIPGRQMTGSFSYIDSQQFNRSISTNLMDRIVNMSTGVYFTPNQGSVGMIAEDIVVRGRSTIFGSKRPLIVIDNFPYEGDFNNINPNDIQSVTILKDAVASGLWSALAGNGVIVITTKKGTASPVPNVSFISNVTVGAKPDLHYQPVMNSTGYLDVTGYLYGKGYYSSLIAAPYQLVPPDVMIRDSATRGLLTEGEAEARIDALRSNDLWSDLSKYMYRRVVNQQYALSLSGGTNKIRNYFSVGYDKNLTNLVRNYYERFTLNLHNTFLLLKDNSLEFTSNIAVAHTNTSNNNNNSEVVKQSYPYTRLADDNGLPAVVQADYRQQYKDTAGGGKLLNWNYKPLDELQLSDNLTKLTDYRVNLGAEYKMDYLFKGLKLVTRYQLGKGESRQEDYNSIQTYYSRNLVNLYTQIAPNGTVTRMVPPKGIIDFNNYDYTSHSLRGQIDYNRTFGKHNVSVVTGMERRSLKTQRDISRYYGYDRITQSRADVDLISLLPLYPTPFVQLKIPNERFSVGTVDNYYSYYANLLYSFKSKYNFSFNLRKDESNLFGAQVNQHGTPLWSVGAGWLISDEDFYNLNWLPLFRIRATHGYTGNIDKTISPYTIIQYASAFNNYNALQAFIANPANRNLRWEKVGITNFAVDFSLRNYRFSGTVEFYLKDIKDLIGTYPVDQTTGVPTFRGNTASMRGKGFDITLNARFIEKRNWKWYGSLLYSYTTNRVTNYVDSGKAINLFVKNIAQNPVNGAPLEAVFAYRWAGLNAANGDPQIFFDDHITDQYGRLQNSTDKKNMVLMGTSVPKIFGSYRNTVSYKNLDFSFMIQYKFGYYFRRPSINYTTLYLGQDFGHTDYERRWQNPGDERFTNIPSIAYPPSEFRDYAYIFSDILVDKADHIRLQDVQVGYTLRRKPSKKLPFESITFNLYLNNIGILWKATDSPLDPDYLNDFYRRPLTSAFGVQVKF